MPKTSTTFKPKQVTKKVLSPLKDRAYEVIVSRYGLGKDINRKTLESIGEMYGITRERVRQIENAAIGAIRKSSAYKEEKSAFDELQKEIEMLGGVVAEADFLASHSNDDITKNHIHFFLVLGEAFTKHKEDDHFQTRWSTDDEVTKVVHNSLRSLYENLSDNEIITEGELITRFLGELKDLSEKYRSEEIAKRYLSLSKRVSKNPLGEWGKAESSGVKTRGIKDFAFLMMRKHGSPMHFKEVAKAISDTFGRKTHIATCHNELIKDPRFVLVGRGIYALKEWGYKTGVVRDVISEVLRENGPMTKEEIVEKVLKERYLKKNTILVNLQNSKNFKKQKDGKYTLA